MDRIACNGLGAGPNFFSGWNMVAALDKLKARDSVRDILASSVGFRDRFLANDGSIRVVVGDLGWSPVGSD